MSEDGAKRHARQIVRQLKRSYPEARCALRYDSPFQLLVATILSAQCTDKQVNVVTKKLFDRYPTLDDMGRLSQTRLERAIQSTGFFRNKAKNIRALCRTLRERHGGQVPQTLQALTSLPGVGRKTANVVLGTAFGVAEGVVVDTHVQRISKRLGLTDHTDPVKIEKDLMRLLPRREWIDYSHRMIQHGRKICKARRPLCDECPLAKVCPRIGVSGDASPDGQAAVERSRGITRRRE